MGSKLVLVGGGVLHLNGDDSLVCPLVNLCIYLFTQHLIVFLCSRELDLKKPIYQRTAAYGHFGREAFPWEVPKKLKY